MIAIWSADVPYKSWYKTTTNKGTALGILYIIFHKELYSYLQNFKYNNNVEQTCNFHLILFGNYSIQDIVYWTRGGFFLIIG